MELWQEKNLVKLKNSINDIDLNEEETRVLTWIAGYDNFTVDNMISIFEKIKEKY